MDQINPGHALEQFASQMLRNLGAITAAASKGVWADCV
jgi:adenylyl- and sulfurtransferase ThiI